MLSPCIWQVIHALLTRPPLTYTSLGFCISPFDLHVLGTPPAFILSQDQTLMLKWSASQPFAQRALFDAVPVSLASSVIELSVQSLYFFRFLFYEHYSLNNSFIRFASYSWNFQGCITVCLSLDRFLSRFFYCFIVLFHSFGFPQTPNGEGGI